MKCIESRSEARMQQKCLPRAVYQINHLLNKYEDIPEIAYKRESTLRKWISLKDEGVSDKVIAKTIGISRATYYIWQASYTKHGILGLIPQSKRPKNIRNAITPDNIKQKVLEVRREFPTWGKFMIAIVLKRDFKLNISESTVGRILKELMRKGIIAKSISSCRKTRPRVFTGHAQRWQYRMKLETKTMGQMIQIDHMTVTKDGVTFKHFAAYDPISKLIVCEVYSCATSFCAAKFLEKVRNQMPFKILSIQVDGGSEFMNHFENACKTHEIELYVLPPRKPQFNGCVERSNRVLREEFYAVYDIPTILFELRPLLEEFAVHYNTYRPHRALKGQTPMAFYLSSISNHSQLESNKSVA